MLLGISEIEKLIKEKKLIENLSKREMDSPEGTVLETNIMVNGREEEKIQLN